MVKKIEQMSYTEPIVTDVMASVKNNMVDVVNDVSIVRNMCLDNQSDITKLQDGLNNSIDRLNHNTDDISALSVSVDKWTQEIIHTEGRAIQVQVQLDSLLKDYNKFIESMNTEVKRIKRRNLIQSVFSVSTLIGLILTIIYLL